MDVPLNPILTPVYPAGVQGAQLLVNTNARPVTVSNISSPYSGTTIPAGGSMIWESRTPLWVAGTPGDVLRVGSGGTQYNETSNISVAAPIVNVPAPVVNVPAPVVNVPAPVISVQPPEVNVTYTPPVSTPEGDEMAVMLSTAQIAGLTVGEKPDGKLIWNRDTNTLYVCEGGELIRAIPAPPPVAVPYSLAVKQTISIPATASGQSTLFRFAIPTGMRYGQITIRGATTTTSVIISFTTVREEAFAIAFNNTSTYAYVKNLGDLYLSSNLAGTVPSAYVADTWIDSATDELVLGFYNNSGTTSFPLNALALIA